MTASAPKLPAIPTKAGLPLPRRILSDLWSPANRYERELVDRVLAPSLAHYADVLLTRDGAAEAKPPHREWFPPDLRDWVRLWPALLQGEGTHEALAVAWWTRLDDFQRRALTRYLGLGAVEYDPATSEPGVTEEATTPELAAAGETAPAIPRAVSSPAGNTSEQTVELAAASLW